MIDFNKIRRRRRELDLTQMEVAERCHFSDSYISMVERGKFTPTIPNLELIAKELGLKIVEIYKKEVVV